MSFPFPIPRCPGLALLSALLAASLGGCAWDGERAQDTFHTEVARDLGGVERDEDEALAAGQRLQARAEQTPLEGALTLGDCFRLAIANSEGLRGRAEQVFQVDMQRREAIAAVLPQVALYGTHTKDSNSISFGGGGSFQPSERTSYGFKVTQVLFNGKLLPRLNVLAETRQIQALLLRDARDQLLFAVASDFYEALGLQADLVAIDATLASAREALRVLEARLEVGAARRNEVLLARASVAEAEARGIQTRADQARAQARLRSVTGRDPLPPLQDTYEVAPGPREIPRLIDLALAQRYDLEAARRGIAEAESSKTLAFTDYLPSLDLSFQHYTEAEEAFNKELDWTLGVNLSWTLFDGGGREARIARAYSTIRRRQLELRAIEEQVRLEVEEAALSFRSFDRALFAFEARAEAASAAHDIIEARLSEGSATPLELLIARDTREDAARNLTRTALGRKLAALRIRLAAGDLRRAAPVAALGQEGAQ